MFLLLCLWTDSTGYVHINTYLTWRDAQSYCRQHHTGFASVSSPEQQRLISNESSFWIGLFLDSWQWSDRSRINFRYWQTGLPSTITVTGVSVAMSTTDSGKWVYQRFDQKLPIICYGGEFSQLITDLKNRKSRSFLLDTIKVAALQFFN